MRVWPLRIVSKFKERRALKQAYNIRKEEFHYRLASDPLTSEIKVRQLRNGSTVFVRYTDKYGTSAPYTSDAYIFRPDMSIESKSYHYIKESNASGQETIGQIITKNFFKKNSYAPCNTTTKTIWRLV